VPYKPKKLKDYLKWIKAFGWALVKGSIDHKLQDENGNHICQIKIVHPPGNEVHPESVRKTERALKDRGFKP